MTETSCPPLAFWLLHFSAVPTVFWPVFASFSSPFASLFPTASLHHNVIRSNWSQIITNFLHKSFPSFLLVSIGDRRNCSMSKRWCFAQTLKYRCANAPPFTTGCVWWTTKQSTNKSDFSRELFITSVRQNGENVNKISAILVKVVASF